MIQTMMQTRGLVVDSGESGFARVVMDRKSACSGCGSGKADKCKTCLSGSSKIQARVRNPQHAGVGDIVTVSMSRTKVMQGAAMFYLIPVAGLLLGAFAGYTLGGALGMGKESAALPGSLAGMILGFFAVRILSDRMNSDQGMIPEITEIVYSAKAGNAFFKSPRACPGCR